MKELNVRYLRSNIQPLLSPLPVRISPWLSNDIPWFCRACSASFCSDSTLACWSRFRIGCLLPQSLVLLCAESVPPDLAWPSDPDAGPSSCYLPHAVPTGIVPVLLQALSESNPSLGLRKNVTGL